MNNAPMFSPTYSETNRGPYRGPYIMSISGNRIYILDDPARDLKLSDIAHSLGMQCRYGGHTREFYSVAEHCTLLSDYAATELGDARLAAWLHFHDAPESVCQDLVGPAKRVLIDYRGYERGVVDSFCKHFPLVRGHDGQSVRNLDRQIMTDEMVQAMHVDPKIETWMNPAPLGVTLQFWPPRVASRRWFNRAREYMLAFPDGVPL